MMYKAAIGLCFAVGFSGCVGSTGSDFVEFKAYATGPENANGSYSFQSDLGYDVTLTRAKVHFGAAYLDTAIPTLGAQATSCILPGLYVASVPGPVDVDVLSGTPQPFSATGEGTATRALAGELWLTGGDINAIEDSTVILDVAGTADKDGASMHFEGQITIGQNRAIIPSSPAMPGSHPICKQRIVSPVPVDFTPRAGGALLIRVKPSGWFSNVNFAKLSASTQTPDIFTFADSNSDQPSRNLFGGLTQASVDTYTFEWVDPAKL